MGLQSDGQSYKLSLARAMVAPIHDAGQDALGWGERGEIPFLRCIATGRAHSIRRDCLIVQGRDDPVVRNAQQAGARDYKVPGTMVLSAGHLNHMKR